MLFDCRCVIDDSPYIVQCWISWKYIRHVYVMNREKYVTVTYTASLDSRRTWYAHVTFHTLKIHLSGCQACLFTGKILAVQLCKAGFPLGGFFRECDWLVMSSMFVPNQSSCFFLRPREQIRMMENNLNLHPGQSFQSPLVDQRDPTLGLKQQTHHFR